MNTYKFYNPHPEGLKVGDCVKRAFTKALGLEYIEVKKILNDTKKIVKVAKFNDNKVWKHLVKEYGFQKLSFQAVKGMDRMDGYKFTKEYKQGTYILRMAGHLVTCVDGVIYDTWDSRRKCVYNAFKVR
jgi:hypothetical protein